MEANIRGNCKAKNRLFLPVELVQLLYLRFVKEMDGYSGDVDSDSTKQQERHYYLLSELQTLVKDLPSSFQQRLSYNTLSDLALALIDGTVYEIVQGLLDIQHLTEKNLYNQRQKLHCEHQGLKQDLVRKHKDALQSCKSHNLALLKSNQQAELEALEIRVREEQRMMDKKIVAEIDQKVIDQQNTLEKAGVPGFYITTNPQELTLQMNLLELILKLQQKESQSGIL
ncbi:protein DGCR6 isoform X1 [Amphiprion ocellaris]|uniref:DiGeorge syndrome critical region gene 6 n=2 Tax=Amphiprion ocellaris TaxID=80972 RepID=A0A3Q1CJ42_AMPOC|nr:protein DGCR6 isoform X1 [Amphiprion ocellaris]